MKKLLFLFSLAVAFAAFGQNNCIPKQPNKLVNDFTKTTLSKQEVAALEHKLVAYNDTTSTQITVVILPDACGDDINLLAVDIAHEWGVGQSDADNGCIILMSMEQGNRQIAIQNGYGLEAYLTDAMSKRIIEEIIIPQFKKNNYYAGLDGGTTAIMQVLAGNFKGGSKSQKKDPPILPFIFLLAILLFFIFGKGGKGGRGGRRGGHHGGYWIGGFGTGGYSGGGSSFGGGGFGGFGGGGFGGGGASGSW